MVQVRILSSPLTSCVTLHLSFPIWKMGMMRVHTLLGYYYGLTGGGH